MLRSMKRNLASPRGGSLDCCANKPQTIKAARQEEQSHVSDLIPIAVVIAAGCEPCAEKMVRRALEQGASAADIGHVLRVVSYMQKLDCFAQALGTEAVERMKKPLAAAERTLQQAFATSA